MDYEMVLHIFSFIILGLNTSDRESSYNDEGSGNVGFLLPRL